MAHTLNIQYVGKSLDQSDKALIMLHGRGANAASILSLSEYLNVKDYALLAPQATNNTWYPYSFITSVEQNEPWLSSAIEIVGQTVAAALKAGIETKNIYFLGFSQGACLTLEYVTRNAQRYGGVVSFIGGLIGEQINRTNYNGDFQQTPVFLGTSNPDFHVPVERVYASANIMKEMNADVHEKIYDNKGHTIIQDEIDTVNRLIFV